MPHVKRQPYDFGDFQTGRFDPFLPTFGPKTTEFLIVTPAHAVNSGAVQFYDVQS